MNVHDGMSLRSDALEAVLAEAVPAGEIVTHYEVIIQTRCGPDAKEIKTRRVSMPGSDPHLSLGILQVQAANLSQILSR